VGGPLFIFWPYFFLTGLGIFGGEIVFAKIFAVGPHRAKKNQRSEEKGQKVNFCVGTIFLGEKRRARKKKNRGGGGKGFRERGEVFWGGNFGALGGNKKGRAFFFFSS